MKKVFVLLLSFFLILTIISCAGEATEQQTGNDQNKDYYTVTTTVPSYYLPITTSTQGEDSKGGSGAVTTSTIDRMIVNNGNMTLIVEDIPDTLDEINRIAQSYNGYVVNSNNWKSGERIYGYISIRVPAEYFSDVMNTIEQLAVEVSARSTSRRSGTLSYWTRPATNCWLSWLKLKKSRISWQYKCS
jgi:hypothetical protein